MGFEATRRGVRWEDCGVPAAERVPARFGVVITDMMNAFRLLTRKLQSSMLPIRSMSRKTAMLRSASFEAEGLLRVQGRLSSLGDL